MKILILLVIQYKIVFVSNKNPRIHIVYGQKFCAKFQDYKLVRELSTVKNTKFFKLSRECCSL